jgi:RNA polymerase sigma-70 factor (ECF subfamily)
MKPENPSDAGFMERLIPCQSRLYRFVASLVPNRADSEDLFQKTCLSAWEQRSTYDPSREMFLWLCGVARNHVRHYYRSRRTSPVRLAPELVEQLADLRLADDAREDQRQRALEGCLEKLPSKDRDVLEVYYSQHRPVRSVAESLGRSADAVFKSLQRLRSGLYDCVAATLSGEASP